MNAHSPIPDAWSYWRDALAARKPVDAPRGVIAPGYYRARDGEAIAFTIDDGVVSAWRSSDKYPAPTDPDRMLDLYARVSPYPVEYEAFAFYGENGRWPDQLEPTAAPVADLPPHEALEAEMAATREQAKAWIEEIKAVTTQEQANKAGNFADAFAKFEKRAAELHKAEKAPFLEGGRLVDQKWKPIAERAAELKTWSKKTSESFLLAEKKRLAEEENSRRVAAAKAQQEAERQRREAEAAGAPPPVVEVAPIAPPPQKAVAGTTGRKIAVRTRTIVEVNDLRAFLEYLANMNSPPPDLLAVCDTIARKLISAGVSPAGVATRQIEEVA